MKNILYITNTLERGGAETQLVNLLKYLDKNQFHPTVCVLKKSGPLEQEIGNLNIPIFFLSKSAFSLATLPALLKIIKKEKIDIIHSSLFQSNFWGRLAGIVAKKKIIASERSAYKKPIRIFADKFLSHFTDKIICNSEAVRQFQIEKEKINPRKLKVIYNGLDIEKFDAKLSTGDEKRQELKQQLKINNNEFVIGNVCRITPEKDLEAWLHIAKRLILQKSNLKFIIAGNAKSEKEIKYKKKIMELIEELKLYNHVTLTDGNNPFGIFAIMNMFFQSSTIEGLPNVVMEAMATELPVVATPAGGTPELITDNQDGIILQGRIDNVTSQIVSLLNHPETMKKLSKNARMTIENDFSAKRLARNTENIYKRML